MSYRLVFVVMILMSTFGHLDPAPAAPKLGKSISERVKQFASKQFRLNPDAQIAATALINEAVENVARNVLKPGKRVTKEELLVQLKEEVAQLTKARAAANPSWYFEYLSGKFSIKQSAAVGGGQVTGGETNLYAVMGVLAAAGASATFDCKMDNNWFLCVMDALKSGRRPAPQDGTGARGLDVRTGPP
jgi:hypothetical protein